MTDHNDPDKPKLPPGWEWRRRTAWRIAPDGELVEFIDIKRTAPDKVTYSAKDVAQEAWNRWSTASGFTREAMAAMCDVVHLGVQCISLDPGDADAPYEYTADERRFLNEAEAVIGWLKRFQEEDD